ncbi:YncE family protein [Myxococcota bacterium]|nr:YncE family protein [Myxococcota bacterium]MBU1537765.1 YncE family protein [Myxococcota bacterium]
MKVIFLFAFVLLSPLTAHGARRVGDSVTISNTKFMIWGGAPTGSMPKGASVAHDGKHLYVSNFGKIGRDNISVFKADPLTFERYIHYKGNSIESYVSRDNKTLYSTNMYGDYFDVIDLATYKLKKRVRIYGGFPKLILLNKTGDKAFVSLWAASSFAVIDLKSYNYNIFRTRQRNPRGLALNHDESLLYLANNGSKNFTVVETSSLVKGKKKHVGAKPTLKHYAIGRGPRHVVASKDGKTMYFSVMGGSRIFVVDTATQKTTKIIHVGQKPKTIFLSFDGKFLYTANYTGHSLSIIDTSTYKVKELPLPVVRTSGLVVRPDDKFIYITGWCTDDIWAVQRINAGETAQTPMGNNYNKFRRKGCRKCKLKFLDCEPIRSKRKK